MLPLSNDETVIGLTAKLSLLYMFIFVAVIVFANPVWMKGQIAEEIQGFIKWSGDEAGEDVAGRAQMWYIKGIKETGIESTINNFIVFDIEEESNAGLRNMGGSFYYAIATSMETFWLMVYQSFFRLSVMLYWSGFLICVFGAALVDGLTQRNIKQYNFGWSSVNVFRMTTKVVVFVPFAFLTYLSIPVIPDYAHLVPPALMLILSIASYYMVSNMQKVF
ncbi:hypothetical protein LCGC14_2752870 [marine sediment metagenome]|uniref:DUF4400 domain-containing protein n=1 Tax=marine sediment metagenome TaxID=412755 RepID=A0A0F8ZNB8_9ZZZZ